LNQEYLETIHAEKYRSSHWQSQPFASGTAFAQSQRDPVTATDMGWMTRQRPQRRGTPTWRPKNAIGQIRVAELHRLQGFRGSGQRPEGDFRPASTGSIGRQRGHFQGGPPVRRPDGGFGTAVAGYLDGLRYGIYGKYNPFGNYSVGNFASMTTQYDRAANAIAYISPAYKGFTLILATSTNTQTPEGGLNGVHSPALVNPSGNEGDDRLFSINLIYADGPLSVDLDYETTKAVGYSDSRLYVATTGISYDFGVVKIGAVYDVIHGQPNSLIGGNNDLDAATPGLQNLGGLAAGRPTTAATGSSARGSVRQRQVPGRLRQGQGPHQGRRRRQQVGDRRGATRCPSGPSCMPTTPTSATTRTPPSRSARWATRTAPASASAVRFRHQALVLIVSGPSPAENRDGPAFFLLRQMFSLHLFWGTLRGAPFSLAPVPARRPVRRPGRSG
jgi:hypothetical protein